MSYCGCGSTLAQQGSYTSGVKKSAQKSRAARRADPVQSRVWGESRDSAQVVESLVKRLVTVSRVGDDVGVALGTDVTGASVGAEVGAALGNAVGPTLGAGVGVALGADVVGAPVGPGVGVAVGTDVAGAPVN